MELGNVFSGELLRFQIRLEDNDQQLFHFIYRRSNPNR